MSSSQKAIRLGGREVSAQCMPFLHLETDSHLKTHSVPLLERGSVFLNGLPGIASGVEM